MISSSLYYLLLLPVLSSALPNQARRANVPNRPNSMAPPPPVEPVEPVEPPRLLGIDALKDDDALSLSERRGLLGLGGADIDDSLIEDRRRRSLLGGFGFDDDDSLIEDRRRRRDLLIVLDSDEEGHDDDDDNPSAHRHRRRQEDGKPVCSTLTTNKFARRLDIEPFIYAWCKSNSLWGSEENADKGDYWPGTVKHFKLKFTWADGEFRNHDLDKCVSAYTRILEDCDFDKVNNPQDFKAGGTLDLGDIIYQVELQNERTPVPADKPQGGCRFKTSPISTTRQTKVEIWGLGWEEIGLAQFFKDAHKNDVLPVGEPRVFTDNPYNDRDWSLFVEVEDLTSENRKKRVESEIAKRIIYLGDLKKLPPPITCSMQDE